MKLVASVRFSRVAFSTLDDATVDFTLKAGMVKSWYGWMNYWYALQLSKTSYFLPNMTSSNSLSLKSGKVPEAWKTSSVVPTPKTHRPSDNPID